MLKLIVIAAGIYGMVHFGIAQLIAIWLMAMIA